MSPACLDHCTAHPRAWCIAPLYILARGPVFGAHHKNRLGGLDRHLHIRIPGGEGVVVGEDHLLGAVVAEGGFVVAADDGKGVEDVGG